MINLYFKNILLGTLSFDYNNNLFVYNSNKEGEKLAELKHCISDDYNLFGCVNHCSKQLFVEFYQFTDCLSRRDIMKRVGINENDNLFEKLFKIASLDFLDDAYAIKQK